MEEAHHPIGQSLGLKALQITSWKWWRSTDVSLKTATINKRAKKYNNFSTWKKPTSHPLEFNALEITSFETSDIAHTPAWEGLFTDLLWEKQSWLAEKIWLIR